MASIFWNAVVSDPFPVSDGRLAVTIKWIGETNDKHRRNGHTTTLARYRMMRHLNRFLEAHEVVEHKDGDHMNDNLDNLRLADGRTQRQLANDERLPSIGPNYKGEVPEAV